MIDFKSLETFVWVVTLRSFNGAAQKLNTTQPAISQRISQLEADMGVRLLNRETRNISPTQAGRLLLGYAERLLNLRSEMLANVRDTSAMRGTLRIGVAETIVHTWLPRFMQNAKRTYPGLTLEIDVDITPSMRSRLHAQEIDLAFLVGPMQGSDIRNRLLCAHRIVFVASPDLAVPRPATIQDLAAFPIFTFPRKTQPYEMVKALFSRHDLAHVSLNASASLATVRLMALGALGIAVLPPEIVQEELADGRLLLIETDITVPDLTFTATWIASPDTLAIELIADIAVASAMEGLQSP